ncbi:MAG: hypothetical protein C0621_03620 [Desulfuromonas sp.]|nr:MAG: hypothetical protein C0621_03620 [Desulfuromonas sp.]
MAKKSNSKLLGAILLAAGIGLAFWGYQLSDSLGSQLTRVFSGAPSNKVMMCYISGGVSAVAGLFLLLRKS